MSAARPAREAAVEGSAAVDGGGAEDAAPDAPSPAPLTSLSSLLGGELGGGAACAADGTCD